MGQKNIWIISKLSWKFLIAYFLVLFSFLSFFSSGTIEAEDGWLYLNVARNIYYEGSFDAPPNEYLERKNVNMNSILQEDGTWKSPGGLGYSLSMLPAVLLSDIYHKVTDIPVPEHFPLESDWSLMFFASFTNLFFAAMIGVIMYAYSLVLGQNERTALSTSLLTVFATNMFPMATFAFAQMMFTAFLLLTFLMIKLHSLSRSRRYLYIAVITYGVTAISYNVSYILVLPAILIYFLTLSGFRLNWKRIGLISLLTGLIVVLAPNALKIISYNGVKLKILFEGVYGLLLSPGKSVFLYSPILVIPIIFWHKISKKYRSELIAFGTMLILYLFFYGKAYLNGGVRGLFPIWYGGSAWGPRYILTTIPFFMLIVGHVLTNINGKVRNWIVWGLIPVSIIIQIIGVLVPYQVQYRGLQANVFINQIPVSYYEYASFIPRYSPLITSTKDLGRKLLTYKKTRDHGDHEVYLYDGFDYPATINNQDIRPFSSQGHIAWKANPDLSEIQISLSNGINGLYSSVSAQVEIMSDGKIISELMMGPGEQATLNIAIEEGASSIDMQVKRAGAYPKEKMLLTNITIGSEVVNISSIDYPYVDYGDQGKTDTFQHKYYGEVEDDLWKLWYMRSRIYEETLDLWWLRRYYYWDLPHKMLNVLAVSSLVVFLVSLRAFFKYRKK